jgi:hypothetical protein
LQQELEDLDLNTLQQRAKSLGLELSGCEGTIELRQRLFDRQRAQSEQLVAPGLRTGDLSKAGNFMGGSEYGGWVGPNWVGSAPHGTGVWTEIFLHFMKQPDALAELFEQLPRTALSATGGADISRGMRIVLSSDKGLLGRVNANRKRLNDETFKYYSAPGATKEEAEATWVVGFLRRNRQDWEESCETLAGDRHAVPYMWEKELAQLELGLEQRAEPV